MTAEEPGPSSTAKKAKRKLEFEASIEHSAIKEKNILNLPYSDSELEPEQEKMLAKENVEYSMEHVQYFEVFSTHEEGETSRKTVTEESKIIKKLKKKLK